jgi:hypothetical protein
MSDKAGHGSNAALAGQLRQAPPFVRERGFDFRGWAASLSDVHRDEVQAIGGDADVVSLGHALAD